MGVGVGDSETERERMSACFSLSVISALRGEMEDRFCKEDKGGKVLCFYHCLSFGLFIDQLTCSVSWVSVCWDYVAASLVSLRPFRFYHS